MKTKVHKLISTALLGVALCSQSLPAWAGAAWGPSNVYVVPGVVAAGYFTGTRYSADNTQFIDCGVLSDTSQLGYLLHCNARDRDGQLTYCYSTDPRLADALKAMTDSSYISVSMNGATCTELTITNASRNLW